jgi:RimJ/RimL family protein N-acetyltransferase
VKETDPAGADAIVAFEYQPALRGPLIDLRPLRESDHDALFAVAEDPCIWEQHPDKTRCEPEGFRRFFREAIESGGALLATRAGTEVVIGSSRFHGYTAATSEVEIGWTFLSRACWGGAYNRELKRLMVEHAFRFVDRIVFLIAPMNQRSQRAVLKIGAIRSGSRVDGSGTESYVFALTAEAWARAVRGGVT